MTANFVATASAAIGAPVERVWDALVNPETIRRYMFGTTVISEWKEGAPIVWKGEWKGKAYEDKGVILELEPLRRLRYTHPGRTRWEVGRRSLHSREPGLHLHGEGSTERR